MLTKELMPGVALRLWEERDAPELYALVEENRAHLAPWMPFVQDASEAAQLDFIRTSRRQFTEDGGLQTAIVVDGRIAGSIGLNAIDRRNDSTEIGYWLGRAHERRGIVTAAVLAHVEHAFGALGLHRLEIRAATGNARSQAVAVRAGFTREGVEREAERIGDRRLDLVVFSRLRTD